MMKLLRLLSVGVLSLLVGLWLVLPAPTVQAQGAAQHMLWSVEGTPNRMYLLGSVHLLRADDELPAAMLEAYERSDTVVMEIDMTTLDEAEIQAATMELAMLPPGERLSDLLDDEAYAELERRLAKLGFSAAMFETVRPWMMAMTLAQLMMGQMGLEPEHGVESRLTLRAIEDGKPLVGLETMREQFEIFARLSAEEERDFLVHTLDEWDEAEAELDRMMAAWKTGDVDVMTEMLLEGFEAYPDLYEAITVTRNRAWMPQLEALLQGEQDVLVVVGALHLVGPGSVVDLLEQAGYEVRQL
jgi:uncharacterized protein